MADLEWLRGAQDDLFDRYLWFEAFGKGDAFYEDLDETLTRLSRFPEMGTVFETPIRRLVLSNWHHGLFYTHEGDRIFLHAILDLRRDPDRILERLFGR